MHRNKTSIFRCIDVFSISLVDMVVYKIYWGLETIKEQSFGKRLLRKMSNLNKSTSDKLHIIDRKTFECIQNQQNTANVEPFRKIRNSKFRKKNPAEGGHGASFNLMQFLTKTPKQKQKAKKLKRHAVCKFGRHTDKARKKRGKTREGGKRKKLSRLKKAIFRCRKRKSQRESSVEQSAELLKETADKISALTIDSKDEKNNTKRITPKHNQGIVKTLHSRRFRSYCDNCTTPMLAELTEELLRELDRFQKRALSQNAIKAHAHRRFVVGIRETQSYLLVNKVKLIIIAPDCEICEGEDGLDAKISNIKSQCQQQSIPYLFALRRRQLAYALFKKAPISCVAILDYDGAREVFSKLLAALVKARQSYEDLT
ncbi:selenocysteine insertion sequence-binding protein 2 isoform X2 [Rhagoletis pomonella]|uniref:selenocysteine insertion sequence-binding protein 2 isoform X2 n=1 Tax=Rhagoletis pomonella TaxID=28610 RepID=UPI001785CDA9|nr:selenocysteine insertion sequence-binding protein 2 isoform X2 [Rhagoletis pomonella]